MLKQTDEYTYHDKRAAAEEQKASETPDPDIAQVHRDLAALHKTRRGWFEFIQPIPRRALKGRAVFDRTDKEA